MLVEKHNIFALLAVNALMSSLLPPLLVKTLRRLNMNKTLLSLACFVFLAGLSGGVSAASDSFCVSWGNETTVTSPPATSVNIIRLDDGTLFTAYILYSGGYDGAIYASKSTDNGTTWGNPFYVGSAGQSLDPSCIQLRNSRIMCAFSPADVGIWTTYSDDYGNTWSAPVNVSRYGFVPDLMELNNGEILLACSMGCESSICIRVMKSTDGGVNWSAPVTVYDSPDRDSKADLLQLNDGTILSGFYTLIPDPDPETGSYWSSLKLVKSYDNGITWTDETTVVPFYSAGDPRWISLLQVNNGEVWAAFNGLELVRSFDGGTTWGNRESITPGVWPSLIQLSDGTFITAFTTGAYPDISSEIHIIKGTEADCPVLSVTKTGSGSGTVTSSPAGIDCGTDCSEVYNAGTTVTLTPTPAGGSLFSGWNGDEDCSDGSVTMNADRTCTAIFNSNVSLTVTSPNGGENWKAGSTHPITWAYAGNPGAYVKIELVQGTSVKSTIAKKAPIGSGGTGSYNWTISKTMKTGSDYKIRITSTSNSSYADTSDGFFTISK